MEITLEDQERINKFSRLNQRRHELNSELKHFKKLMEDVEEASGEWATRSGHSESPKSPALTPPSPTPLWRPRDALRPQPR